MNPFEETKLQPPLVHAESTSPTEPMATGDQTGASLQEVEAESKEQQPEAAGETGSQQSSQIIAAAAPIGQVPPQGVPLEMVKMPLMQVPSL